MNEVGVSFFLLWFAPPLLLWGLAVRDALKSCRMARWPRVLGAVCATRTRPGTRGVVKLDVQMRFPFEGQEITTWCPSPTGAGFSVRSPADRQAFDRRVADWKAGMSHRVIINPDDPLEAYVRMPEWHMLAALVIAGFVWIAGIGLMWIGD